MSEKPRQNKGRGLVDRKLVFLSSPLAVTRDKVVAILAKMYVRVCVGASGFVRAITPTFIYGFQNYLA